MAERILVVEDEEHIALGIRLNLEAEGWESTVSGTGEAALELLEKETFDLVILDVMLPGITGFEVCDTVRSRGNFTPILFLTARDDEDDRVRGLEAGGDDYLIKPFHLKELISRIRAILRRKSWYESETKQRDELVFGGNRINFNTFEGNGPSGKVTLTQKECMILKLLADNEGTIIDRDTILDKIWGYDRYPSSRTIDNLILNLRRYFEKDPKNPVHILTRYGAGYIFTK